MHQMEKSIIEKWNTSNQKFKKKPSVFFHLVYINAVLAVSPIAYETLNFTTFHIFMKNILNEAYWLLAAPVLASVSLFNSISSMVKGNFGEMFINLLFIPILPALIILAVALDLSINLASFITRPIATLFYLASSAITLMTKVDEDNCSGSFEYRVGKGFSSGKYC